MITSPTKWLYFSVKFGGDNLLAMETISTEFHSKLRQFALPKEGGPYLKKNTPFLESHFVYLQKYIKICTYTIVNTMALRQQHQDG